jgi:regulator of sigma E protease
MWYTSVIMSLSAILLFIIILLVLVIVHEFGHFIVAKLTKMRVDEFAFGFPPRIFGKKIGETTYAFNALPLGGYVSIWGENGSEEDKEKDGAKNHPRAFGNRPWWAQLLVLIAGVTMNMLLALFIFIGISYGTIIISAEDEVFGHRIKNSYLIVADVSKESPAYKAGVIPGSTILKVTSAGDTASLTTATSLVAFIGSHQNSPFNISYKSPDGQQKSTTVAAVYGIVKDKKALGISIEQVGTVKTTFGEAIALGYGKTVTITILTLEGLVSVVTSLFEGDEVLSSLSGPVGIAKIVGQTSEYGVSAVLTLVAVLSINLAIFNILPLPALDGGRIVIVVIETIFRKKIPFKYYSWTNVVGFFLLMLLLVVVTVNDIRG